MTASKEELMSISSNSLTISDDVPKLEPKKKKSNESNKKPVRYKLHVAHVPKRSFQQIHRKLKRNKPIIPEKSRTLEKSHCDRFILREMDGNQMDTISPDSTTRLMWEMRERLQRKEYGDLARLISMFTEIPTGKQRWYPTLLKYCLIVLMYDPLVKGTGLMDMFLEGVMGCRSEADKQETLKSISQLPDNIHGTKYEDLWSEYPLSNQMDKESLDELCQKLNEKLDMRTDVSDSDVSDSSQWESYDENSSNGDIDAETTESEKCCDINDAMNQLQKNLSK